MRWIPIGTIVFRYSMQSPIGNPETLRQRRAENSMFDQIDNAVDLRLVAEKTFKENIVSELKRLILTLAECDPSNARTVLDLTQQELGSIITKLNDNSVINTGEATKIANIVKENNLFRGPIISPSTPPLTVPSLPIPSSTVPVALPTQTPGLYGRRPPPLPPTPSRFPPPLPLVPQSHPLVSQSDPLKPRGGRRTRRKGKSKRIV